MSSSSGGGIGIGGIIFICFIAYNLFFDDDDEDKKDVEGKKTHKPVISEETKESLIKVKEDAKKVIEDTKQALIEAAKDYKKEKGENKEVIITKDETIIVTDNGKAEKIETAGTPIKKDIPSLQLPNKGPSEGQPTFRTIE